MDNVGQNLIDPGFAEQMESAGGRTGCKREMLIPERVGQSAEPFGDFIESGR